MLQQTPTSVDFQKALLEEFQRAERLGLKHVDIKAGDLHSKVGGYPHKKGNHRMPVCCYVMKHLMRSGDVVLHEPPKGQGASLTIRYKLPR